ncbi:hypothetical protein D3C81_1300820 [compost metagenome]
MVAAELVGETGLLPGLQHLRARAVEVEVAAGCAPLGEFRLPHLGAGQVDEVHALGHRQQARLAGVDRAQPVQPVCHVLHRAEVDRAFHAQQLQLRAFGLRAAEFVEGGEAAAGVVGVGHEAAHCGTRGAIQVSHQRQDGAEQHGHLQPDHQRGGEGAHRDGEFRAREAGDAAQPR